MKLSKLALGLAFSAAVASPSLAKDKLKGTVKLDGSSTVFPVAEAVAEEYQKVQPRVRVTVGLSGTGGGFKKFGSGEVDIATASRPIKPKEKKRLVDNKINFLEFQVAVDGISVVLHKSNDFAKKLTIAQLSKIWGPGSKVKFWNEIDPSFPKKEIKLYGPGADSGTFDFFTKKVNGKARSSRADYVASEDDNVIVTGATRDTGAMGYFGYAYYLANQDKLSLVSVSKASKDKKPKYITPTPESIENGDYPLSRPLLIYVNIDAAKKRPELADFVKYFINNAAELSKEVGYIPLPRKSYENALSKLTTAIDAKKSH